VANFRDYLFTRSQVTTMVVDQNSGNYLWIAYTAVAGECLIQKVSAFDLTQVFFSVSLPVTSINDMKILGTFLYVAVIHATIAVYKISVTNPLSSQTTYTKTTLGITESPIAITISSPVVYFLTPGNISGENSKLVLFTSGNYDETVDLTESAILIDNAVSLTVDGDDNIWIVTSDDPANLYRVFFQSGGWHIQETILS
jgi:hypothetical protein